MCRIAGIILDRPTDNTALVTAMANVMAHGGPDDDGIYVHEAEGIALAHRRLALIDLSPSGHQPMQSKSGKTIIVFNGEIYNYQEIKKQLLQKGYAFTSTSDTEVVLAAYEEWGTASFTMFNGMFAMALYNVEERKLVLVRDYAGIKPLYYHKIANEIYFASEVKAFKQIHRGWNENPLWKQLFLIYGFIPEPYTTLENVYALPKGHYAEIDVANNQFSLQAFYKPSFNYTIHNEEEAVGLLKEKLSAAVKRHLISDAPIGLFLSGGIDSSLLTLLAQPFVEQNLHTLSVVFEDEKFSEKKYQDLIINKTGANHKSFLVTERDFFESLPDILAAMDQPSNDGINSYFISKYAKAYGLKAVLSGLGADELFGGYPSFNREQLITKARILPESILHFAGNALPGQYKKLAFLSLQNTLQGNYLFNRGFFTPKQAAALLDCSEEEIIQHINALNSLVTDASCDLSYGEQTSFAEFNIYMQNQLLRDTDYMSMWHSIEVRVPFLDKEIIQLAHVIHPSIRFKKNEGKHLLIKAFKDILPEEIWNRKKQGFVFPFEKWMCKVNLDDTSAPVIRMQQQLQQGKIHWSKYWCFLLAKHF
ncbi:MAG: asparagine synthase (glutamine-hydrolyzing) [Chitinophaga sp.]|jgi:asparagine synthase (glutamine-hydrolysing)|nr:asparagine synthase (glutamine-hydrolyzing) [Chitinophaga sp.]